MLDGARERLSKGNWLRCWDWCWGRNCTMWWHESRDMCNMLCSGDSNNTWQNELLHVRLTPQNGEWFLDWLHFKCARLWVILYGFCSDDYDLLGRDCLTRQCSPLELRQERNQTRCSEGVPHKCQGCGFRLGGAMQVDYLEWMVRCDGSWRCRVSLFFHVVMSRQCSTPLFNFLYNGH